LLKAVTYRRFFVPVLRAVKNGAGLFLTVL
jgi:hypothetical protein